MLKQGRGNTFSGLTRGRMGASIPRWFAVTHTPAATAKLIASRHHFSNFPDASRKNLCDRADNCVIIDTEPNGPSPKRGNLVLEMGAVRLEKGVEQEACSILVDHEGLKHQPDYLAKARRRGMLVLPEAEAMRHIKDMAGHLPLAAYNANFDRAFLLDICNKHNISYNPFFVDVMALAYRAFRGLTGYKLAMVCEHLKLEMRRGDAFHQAEADARMAGLVYTQALAKLSPILCRRGMISLGVIEQLQEAPAPQFERTAAALAREKGKKNVEALLAEKSPVRLPYFDVLPLAKTKSAQQALTDLSKYRSSVVSVRVYTAKRSHSSPFAAAEMTVSNGTGTVVMWPRGVLKILTANHVIKGASIIEVRPADSCEVFHAECVATGPETDLALVQVPSSKFDKLVQPMPLGGMAECGRDIVLAGYCEGGEELHISHGKVTRYDYSKLPADSDYPLLQMQVDAVAYHGNSGGPATIGGKLVGMLSGGHPSLPGVNFVIPSMVIKQFLSSLQRRRGNGYHYPGYPLPDFNWAEVIGDIQLTRHKDVMPGVGVLVHGIDKGLQGEKPSLIENDLLVNIAGLAISHRGMVSSAAVPRVPFTALINTSTAKAGVPVTFLRNQKVRTITYRSHKNTCNERISETTPDLPPEAKVINGMIFQMGSPQLAAELGDAAEKGVAEPETVVLNQVLPCFERRGCRDIRFQPVATINGYQVKSLRDVNRALAKGCGFKGANTITSTDSWSMIVRNLSPAREQALCAQYNIPLAEPKSRAGSTKKKSAK